MKYRKDQRAAAYASSANNHGPGLALPSTNRSDAMLRASYAQENALEALQDMDLDSDDEDEGPRTENSAATTTAGEAASREAALLEEDRRLVEQELTAYLADSPPKDAKLRLVAFWEVCPISFGARPLLTIIYTSNSTINLGFHSWQRLPWTCFRLKRHPCPPRGCSRLVRRPSPSAVPTSPPA